MHHHARAATAGPHTPGSRNGSGRGRNRLRHTAVGLIAAAMVASPVTPSASAGTRDAGHRPSDHRATQQALDAAVRGGPPGALARAERGHDVWTGRSGTADLASGRQPRDDDRFRAGSLTKTFVAAVMLQLEAEGRLSLTDTVDHWLPGVVRGKGHDGTGITVRQLLNHTSGIYSYTDDPGFKRKEFGTGFLRHRFDTWTPEHIVRLAMTHEPSFAPGTGWSYSDTNYVLAAMVIQKATGRAYAREIERRILRPLHLDSTTFPGTRTRMPGPSGRAYSKLTGELGGPADPKSTTYDVSELNPSLAGAAGEMITNTRDLNRFYRSLLSGRILKEPQRKEMTTTVPIKGVPDVSYGLGLMKFTLSCGVEVWGHNGGIQGSISQSVTTANGEHALSLNLNGDWNAQVPPVTEAEFCTP